MPDSPDDPGNPGNPQAQCTTGETACSGGSYQTCDGGQLVTKMTCAAPQICDKALACVDCRPGVPTCMGDEVHDCNGNGTLGGMKQTCSPGQCKGGACQDTCGGPGVDLIYVVDSTYRLLSFNPRMGKNEFTLIGKLNCPAGASLPGWGDLGPATPFSMSVDRDAKAWVLYTSGEIFLVNTKDASCTKSMFRPAQSGFDLFGMGFVSDAMGSTSETLHICGGPADMVEDGNLGKVDKKTLTVASIGNVKPNQYGPELTGTGNGELYGYFPGEVQTVVAQINKTNAQNAKEWSLGGLGGAARAWAFAHWGGRFYIFITIETDLGQTISQVHLFDPATAKSTVILPNIPYIIVGAGVSTCAPVVVE